MTSTIASTTYTVGNYVASEDYRSVGSEDGCGVYGGGFYCTLPKGEHAEHVAAQSTRLVVAVWPNEQPEPTFTVGGQLPEELVRRGTICRQPNGMSTQDPSTAWYCSRQADHDGDHVATRAHASDLYIMAVWPQAAPEPEPEPEDEVTAYKREVRAMAERKLRDGYGEYGTWNATLKRLGIEPLTKRTIRVTAPIHRVRLELSASDYSVERAQEWLDARKHSADLLANYLRPQPEDIDPTQATVEVEETADIDEDLDSDEDYRASTTDLDTYKELVQEAAGDLQERHSWCDDGTNTVLRELGIDVLRDFRVEVRVRAYQTVYVSVTATNADEAIRRVDHSDISDGIDRSEWEWDGDWDSDDMEAEEDD